MVPPAGSKPPVAGLRGGEGASPPLKKRPLPPPKGRGEGGWGSLSAVEKRLATSRVPDALPPFPSSHLPPRWTLPPAATFAQGGETGHAPLPPSAPPPRFILLSSSKEQVALYARSPSCRKVGRQGCHLPCQPRPPLPPPGGTAGFPRRHQRCARAFRRGASARARDPPPPCGHRRGPCSRRFDRSSSPWRPPPLVLRSRQVFLVTRPLDSTRSVTPGDASTPRRLMHPSLRPPNDAPSAGGAPRGSPGACHSVRGIALGLGWRDGERKRAHRLGSVDGCLDRAGPGC